jgi:hypothetical protein
MACSGYLGWIGALDYCIGMQTQFYCMALVKARVLNCMPGLVQV